jgi:hypothetical protein
VRKKSTESVAASSPTWETLEAFARTSMQQLLQRVLEEQVDGVLGRTRYERRGPLYSRTGVEGYSRGDTHMPKFEKGKPKPGWRQEGHADEFVASPATKVRRQLRPELRVEQGANETAVWIQPAREGLREVTRPSWI